MKSADITKTKDEAAFRRAVTFITLGCAKNEVDSKEMAHKLAAAGYLVVDDLMQADAVIINTCSFIQAATEESLDAVFDTADEVATESRQIPLIVAGCMPARYGESLEDELTEASAFVPCSKEDDIVAVVESLIGPPTPETNSARDALTRQHISKENPFFSYVKISDGCDRWCSYCTIPLIRGRYRSFPYDRIRDDVLKEITSGAREIILIAQDTGRWGTEFETDRSTLSVLLSSLAEEFPDTWFRVMYIQPEGINDELLNVMATYQNICPYLDIPLQHVNPSILHNMNRKGSMEEFAALADHIRKVIPDVTLRTTLIAGFPGETEDMFAELETFVSDSPFDYVGVFPYSREEGTRAANLPFQIDDEEKAYRAQRIRDIADANSSVRIKNRIGDVIDVLIEGAEEDGQLFGRGVSQAPEVDGLTFVDRGTVGEVVKVRITDTLFYDMEGEVL